MKGNNVTRMLDARKIPYQAFEFPAQKMSAVEVARQLSVPPETVYKSIVITRENQGKPLLALVPGPAEVDLKKLAKALGEKKVYLPSERQAEQITHLQAGGISPLALLNRGFQVVIDHSAQTLDQILISGGQRGLDIRISPNDLRDLTQARFADISRSETG